MNSTIRVFEHEKVFISERFTREHYNSLIAFGEEHGFKYFNMGRDSVKFRSYTGIIQIGSLIIEILPKTYKDRDIESCGDRCYDMLIIMLQRSGMLSINHSLRADQNLKKLTLLELYFRQFLKEAETLIYHGLKKQYKKEEKNRKTLTGKLLLSEQIRRNYVHKERFYTSAESYDRDNIYNRILKKALGIIYTITDNKALQRDASNLLLHLRDVKNVFITDKQLERLQFNRHTERYKRGMELAKIILLQMMPDLSGGKNSVTALLFDMNALFERFITKELQRELPEYTVQAQKPQKYLLKNRHTSENSFLMKPDITIKKGDEILAILDTKWKLLTPDNKKRGVSQSDLYQLYTYSSEYNCQKAVLIYPKWRDGQKEKEHFTFRGSEKSLFVISVDLSELTAEGIPLRGISGLAAGGSA